MNGALVLSVPVDKRPLITSVIDAIERDLEALAATRSRALEIVGGGEVAELLARSAGLQR